MAIALLFAWIAGAAATYWVIRSPEARPGLVALIALFWWIALPLIAATLGIGALLFAAANRFHRKHAERWRP
jgi:hypothetical protein